MASTCTSFLRVCSVSMFMKNDFADKAAGLEDIVDAESEGTGGGRKEERTEDRLLILPKITEEYD